MLIVLAIVSTLAGYLPARRASRIDPLVGAAGGVEAALRAVLYGTSLTG